MDFNEPVNTLAAFVDKTITFSLISINMDKQHIGAKGVSFNLSEMLIVFHGAFIFIQRNFE